MEIDPPLRKQMEWSSFSGVGCVYGQAAVGKCSVLSVCLSVYTRRGEMEEKKEVPSERKATDRRIRGEQKPQGDMRGSSRDWCGGDRGRERQMHPPETAEESVQLIRILFKAQRGSPSWPRTHSKSQNGGFGPEDIS